MLTPKEEKFCQLRASDASLTQHQAYITAGYPDSKSARKLCCELEAKLHIKKRIMDLRDLAAMEGLWSRKQSIDVLKGIVEREIMLSDNGEVLLYPAKDTDKINATKVLNEMCGYNAPIKMEVNSESKTTLTLIDLYDSFEEEQPEDE